jgi:hypothetical protein
MAQIGHLHVPPHVKPRETKITAMWDEIQTIKVNA